MMRNVSKPHLLSMMLKMLTTIRMRDDEDAKKLTLPFSLRGPHETSFPNMPSGHTMRTGRIYYLNLSGVTCSYN